jgi:lipid II:glycine glycyltransferase (peptidoglycan interpeptide bridge formation enzyme)
MIGYIILAVVILFVLACFFSFIGGWKHGKKQTEVEYAEEQRRKEQDKKDFDKAQSEIKSGVFGNAEQKKSGLSGGSSGRDRFNNANSALNDKL